MRTWLHAGVFHCHARLDGAGAALRGPADRARATLS